MENPSFFKVIIGDDFRTTLRIPPYFKKHLGDEIRGTSLLRGYGGRQWKVKMGVVDEDIYFENGWERFVSDNLISFGDFLVFFYDGNGGFDLKIYGSTCCEKDELFDLKEVKVEQEVDELDNEASAIAKRQLTPYEKVYKRKRKFRDLAKNVLAEEGSSGQKNGRRIITGLRTSENAKALKAACAFRTSNPHYITPCRKSRATYMTIPMELIKEFKLDEKSKIIVRDPRGTSWPIRLSMWQDGRMCLGSGWANLYKENKFRDGDVCILEFVQGGYAINIHIFRAAVHWIKCPKSHRQRSLNPEDKARVQSVVKSFHSVHPNFITMFRPFSFYHMPIPKRIALDVGLLENQKTTLVNPSGNSWPVKISLRTRGQVELGIGFGLFSKENNLVAGDVCIFEFVEGAEKIQVHIYRSAESSNSSEKNAANDVSNVPILSDNTHDAQ